MSFVLLKVIALVVPLRASAGDQMEGLDVTQHGEEAYIHGSGFTTARADTAGSVSSLVVSPASPTY
jgi:hypothetical protein